MGGPSCPLFDAGADLIRTALPTPPPHPLPCPRHAAPQCSWCGESFDRFCDHAAVCPPQTQRCPRFLRSRPGRKAPSSKRESKVSSSPGETPTDFLYVPASTDPPMCGFPSAEACSCLRPAARKAGPPTTTTQRLTEPRDTQADVPRHSQQVPSERQVVFDDHAAGWGDPERNSVTWISPPTARPATSILSWLSASLRHYSLTRRVRDVSTWAPQERRPPSLSLGGIGRLVAGLG